MGFVEARPGQDVHLLAGQLYFGNTAARVHTLLGSCVAITLWNPVRQLGGMCHFLLPSRQRPFGVGRDGRFGNESLEMLVEALLRAGSQPKDYQAHLYGGADTLPETGGHKFNVGARNIEQGWNLIDRYGFMLQNVDVGDHVPRNVSMTFPDGTVQMRRGMSMKSPKAR
ncbi:MAG TPA: chemotaxis protein CheD [Aquabacterium sp.]|nr:chemotaxis protein CheD [Aquabacterium sp.]